MDVLNQQVDLRVHQIRLRVLWDLSRTKLEHTLHTSISGIYPTSRNDSTAWKGRDALPESTLHNPDRPVNQCNSLVRNPVEGVYKGCIKGVLSMTPPAPLGVVLGGGIRDWCS